MLKHLSFAVAFPTGLTISQDINLEPGLTAISGRNGSGKSLILEMICFALFGSEALRGSVEDHKKSRVELDFSVRGKDYNVARTSKDAYLKLDGETVIAHGTRPVNQKLAEIFGYGYNVFSVSNLIGQGQIEALAALKPSERKKLVDTTIGLDAVDGVIAWTSSEASLARAEAGALTSVLVEPSMILQPENYKPSDELKVEVEATLNLKQEKDRLLGWLEAVQTEPEKPSCEIEETAEELKAELSTFQAVKNELTTATSRLRSLPVAKFNQETIDLMRQELESSLAWEAYDNQIAKLPPQPARSRDEVVKLLHLWDDFDEQVVTCPKCQHEFTPGHMEVLASPGVPRVELQRNLQVWEAWAKAPAEPDVPRPTTVIDYDKRQLLNWEAALSFAEERVKLEKLVATTVLPRDVTEQYHVRVKYETDLAAYDTRKARYDAWVVQRDANLERVKAIGDVETKLTQVNAAYHEATGYERALRTYEGALQAYQQGLAKVEAVTKRAEEMKKSSAALRELKVKVKAHLVPSLNKVASRLIQEMTAGQPQELYDVKVTEDFEISVDGQAMETLNGSGKTVANLAIRIALGQLLTNKVFSVLLADEVDAACDDERSAAIAGCLRGLTSSVKQVISVSHKDIEADHYLMI